MVIPGVHNAFCGGVKSCKITEPQGGTRTTNVLLFRRTLFCAGCLLDVNSQFLFCFVLVHWSRGIVNFIAVKVKTSTRPSSV